MIDGSEYLTTEIMQIFSAVYKKKLIIILNKADKTLMVRHDDVYNHLKESADKGEFFFIDVVLGETL